VHPEQHGEFQQSRAAPDVFAALLVGQICSATWVRRHDLTEGSLRL
jgi:hypothetical protein